MEPNDMIFKLLTDLDKKTDNISESQIRVEADLKYHIKRTNLLEDKIQGVITWKHIAQAIATVGIIATILKTTGVI